MDSDLQQMSREQLTDEIKKLRQAIRQHRDSIKHELCWHQPALWGLLPEKTDPIPVVPDWPEFIQGCVKYRQSLDDQAPDRPRTNERSNRLAAANRAEETLLPVAKCHTVPLKTDKAMVLRMWQTLTSLNQSPSGAAR